MDIFMFFALESPGPAEPGRGTGLQYCFPRPPALTAEQLSDSNRYKLAELQVRPLPVREATPPAV
jgi:hypothetical protein